MAAVKPRSDAASAPKARSASTRKVFVTCLVPSGLVLRLQDCMDVKVPKQGGDYIFEKQWRPRMGAPVFTVRGPSVPVGPVKGYKVPNIEDGFAITRGIPVDFWSEWLEQNKDASYVQEGMIVAHDTEEDAIAWAHENAKLRSGLEPISTDQDKDGNLVDKRLPRPLNPFLSGVQEDKVPAAR